MNDQLERECVRYMNETGHVQGLRVRLRERLGGMEAVDCERILDAIIARSIELAFEKQALARRNRKR